MLWQFFGAAAVVILAFSIAVSQVQEATVMSAIDAGKTKQVEADLQAAINQDPGYHLNYYLLGRVYWSQDQFQKAAEQFRAALEEKDDHWESQYYLGRALIKLGELDEAEEVMERGLKKSKDLKAQFENGMGLLYLARKQYNEADKAFRRALAQNEAAQTKILDELQDKPMSEADKQALSDSLMARYREQNAEYHINLGDANFYQGVAPLAIIEYEKALEVDSGSLEVYYHWAEACLEIRDYACAIEKLKVVLRKDSTHAPAWNRAGGIYFKAALSSRDREQRKARFQDAIGSYKKYLELSEAEPDSSNVRVYYELALAYSNLFGFEDAVPYFESVLSIPYEPRDIYFWYGKALWGTQQYVQAAEMLEKHIDWVEQQGEDYTSRIRDFELHQLLGDAYFYRKPRQYMEAVNHYKKSLEERPDQKRLLQNVAIAYHSLESYGQAIKYYDDRIALGIDAKSANILKNAGYCALNIAGGQSEADGMGGMEEELDLFGDGDAAVVVSDVPADEGIDPEKNYFEVAVDYLKKYLEYDADDDKVMLRIANTYLYQMEDCSNGVTYFEKLLALDPDNCDAHKAIGFAYFGGICNKNYSKSLTHLQKAYNCADEPCNANEVAMWIAQAYHLRAVDKPQGEASSDFKNAHDWYVKVLKCDPGNADAKKGRDDTSFEF